MKVAALPRLWGKSIHSFRTMLSGVSIRDLKLASLVQYLSFHEIKSRVGLSTASFLAFLIGLGCVAGALLVGFLSAKTLVDWQAIQFYRAEWLLAATACFAAGILLKKEFPGNHD